MIEELNMNAQRVNVTNIVPEITETYRIRLGYYDFGRYRALLQADSENDR